MWFNEELPKERTEEPSESKPQHLPVIKEPPHNPTQEDSLFC